MVQVRSRRGQASVLTVVIMIVMVVFSIYAMTEYAIVIDSPVVAASATVSKISGSTLSNYTISSTLTSASNSGCLSRPLCSSSIKTILTSTSSTDAINQGDLVLSGAVACPVLSEGNVVLTAIDSATGLPLRGLGVQATDTLISCTGAKSIIQLGQSVTNGSGVVSLCCNSGSYNISLVYGGATYFANANVSGGGSACVSLYLPAGRVSISYSATIRSYCSSQDP